MNARGLLVFVVLIALILAACTAAPSPQPDTPAPPPPTEQAPDVPTPTPGVQAPAEQPTPIPTPATMEDLATQEGTAFVENQLMLELAEGADEAAVLSEHSLTLLHRIDALGLLVVRSERSATETYEALQNDPRVAAVYLDVYGESQYGAGQTPVQPNDSYYGEQWGLQTVSAPACWQRSTGNSDVVIAIVDSGVDVNHPDLAGKIVPGYDFIQWDEDPADGNGHGTHVAGIAAAATNNAQGVAGMSWGASILPVRVLNNVGKGPMSSIAAGIVYAADHARIINLSLGTDVFSNLANVIGNNLDDPLYDAVQYAYSKGALIVVAAGNEYDFFNTPSVPASYPHVLAVGAVDRNREHAYFSNAGNYVDVVAPGVDILSTMPTGAIDLDEYLTEPGYGRLDGTSQAAPYVSGLAALIWSVAPNLTADQVQGIIETTATKLGNNGLGWEDPCYGAGLINADAALAAAAAGQRPAATDHGSMPMPGLCGIQLQLTPLPTLEPMQPWPTLDFGAFPTLPPMRLP